MSRIRSVHPGLFTDDDFMELSSDAKLLLIGIWTECDDFGCFEWKPKRIKARLFPCENVSVIGLLGELVDNRFAMQYEVDGKTYGAIRNFCKFQRPQKPNRFCPDTEAVREFTWLAERERRSDIKPKASGGDEIDDQSCTGIVPVQDQSDTGTEIHPQKEGKKEGRKVGRDTPLTPQGDLQGLELVSENEPLPDPFDEFKAVYPRRKGNQPWPKARDKFRKLVRDGVETSAIINGAKRCARFNDAEGKTGTQFVPMAITWLNQRGWEQDWSTGDDEPHSISGLPAYDTMVVRG